MKKGIKIDFEAVKNEIYNEGANYEMYCYIRDIFEGMQDIANLDGNSILGQLEYANNCGSYSCNALITIDRLNKIYFSICEFIEEYEEMYGENLSNLYFKNIEAFEIYLLYDLYYKYIQEYDIEKGDDDND